MYNGYETITSDLGFIPSCDECWGAQAPCDEHAEDFEV